MYIKNKITKTNVFVLKMKNDCHMSAQNLHYSKVRWYIPIPDSVCGSFHCGLNAMATFHAFYFCYKKLVGLDLTRGFKFLEDYNPKIEMIIDKNTKLIYIFNRENP